MTKENKSYKDLKRSLDEVLEKIQSPDCDLDEVLELHEKASKIVSELEDYLDKAQAKINKLKTEE